MTPKTTTAIMRMVIPCFISVTAHSMSYQGLVTPASVETKAELLTVKLSPRSRSRPIALITSFSISASFSSGTACTSGRPVSAFTTSRSRTRTAREINAKIDLSHDISTTNHGSDDRNDALAIDILKADTVFKLGVCHCRCRIATWL